MILRSRNGDSSLIKKNYNANSKKICYFHPCTSFSGDKKSYQSWKVTFMTCINQAPVTPEYYLLKLGSYLKGEALKARVLVTHQQHIKQLKKD